MNRLITFFLLLHIIASSFCFAQHPVINEVMFSNQNFLADSNGDYFPWVEIYNPTSADIQLQNYVLTTVSDRMHQWQLPHITISAGHFVVVYMAGGLSTTSPLHAPLSLINGESSVSITDYQGNTFDEIKAHCVRHNLSYARPQDGFGLPVVFQIPSPGVSNALGSWQYEPENRIPLDFSQNGGFYKDVVTVAISKEVTSGEIYYTLNTSEEPSLAANAYTNPLELYERNTAPNYWSMLSTTRDADDFSMPQDLIAKSNVLRAQVFDGGCPASKIYTENYIVNSSGKNTYNVNVAAITARSVDLFGSENGIYTLGNNENFTQHGDNWERLANLEMFDDEGGSILNQQVGLRIHGAGTREAPQKSLRLYAKSSYGNSYFNYSFFEEKDLEKFKRLILRTTMGDFNQNVFKDELCHYLVRNLNVDYQASVPTVLFLNGEYWGIQNLRERQDKYYLQDNHQLQQDDFDIVDYVYGSGPVADNGDLSSYNYLVELVTNNDLNQPEVYAEIEQMVDIDNAIDYFAAQLYFANLDFPERNYTMWKPKFIEGKWRWLFYDCDACMMRSNYNSLADIIIPDGRVQEFPEWSTLIFKSLMSNNQFRNQFSSRVNSLLSYEFSANEVIKAIERFKTMYEPLIAEHIERWNYPADYNLWLQYVDGLRMFALVRPVEVNKLIERYFGNPFILYPNPAIQSFNIDFFGANFTSIQLYNLQGKLLQTYFPNSSAEEVFHANIQLNSGTYLVKVLIDGKFYLEKLVVSN